MTTPLEATRAWLEGAVIGHNFCPFARREYINERIKFVIVGTKVGFEEALEQLADELQALNTSEMETTLIVFAEDFKRFDDFIDLMELGDQLIDACDYRGIYQLAHFHPMYLFDGEAPDAASHYTNRSPYPTLHLLRESSLANVLRDKTESDDIVAANIETCELLGNATLQNALHQNKGD